MSEPLVPLSPALPATRPATTYARASLAPATLRAYQAGWLAFAAWCQLSGRAAKYQNSSKAVGQPIHHRPKITALTYLTPAASVRVCPR